MRCMVENLLALISSLHVYWISGWRHTIRLEEKFQDGFKESDVFRFILNRGFVICMCKQHDSNAGIAADRYSSYPGAHGYLSGYKYICTRCTRYACGICANDKFRQGYCSHS